MPAYSKVVVRRFLDSFLSFCIRCVRETLGLDLGLDLPEFFHRFLLYRFTVFRNDDDYRQLRMKCSAQYHVSQSALKPLRHTIHITWDSRSLHIPPSPYCFKNLEMARCGEGSCAVNKCLEHTDSKQIRRNRYGSPETSGHIRPHPPPEPSGCYHSHYSSLPISTNMLTVPPRAC